MTIPRLARRQRELFALVYAEPRTLTELARAAGMPPSDALKTLGVLELHDLITREGRTYRPAEWTVRA